MESSTQREREAHEKMITTLMFRAMHGINITKGDTINIDGKKVKLSDIPFIRFDFAEYSERAIGYISDACKKFRHSVPIIQISVNEHLKDNMTNISQSGCSNMCKFLYIDVTDKDIEVENFDPEWTARVVAAPVYGNQFERIMIIDKTTMMSMVVANKLRTYISTMLHVNIKDIGVCSSPLCMSGEIACLNAQKAREIAAKYSDNTEIAVPTSNHQSMNTCGCIRYMVVNEAINEIAIEKKKKTKSAKENDSLGANMEALFSGMNMPVSEENAVAESEEHKETKEKKVVKKPSKSSGIAAFSNFI